MNPVELDAGMTRTADGELLLAGVPLAELAEQLGTPLYCYNAEVIDQRLVQLQQALAQLPHQINYAIKANSNLAILARFARRGVGADIVSGGEMLRALAAGFPPGRIVFSGAGKTDEELVAALTCGVGQISVESLSELHRLAVLSDNRPNDVPIGLRINPDVTVDTHPYISTGHGGLKFGIPIDQLDDALRVIDAAPALQLNALAVHLGSQLLSADPYSTALDTLLPLLEHVREARHRPTVLGLGGGLGIRYHNENPLTPAEWVAPLQQRLHQSDCSLHLEPGRFLVGNAGVLLARVIHRKYAGGREIVVVDAAMNDLIRPALYQAWHEIVPVSDPDRSPVDTDVVGPVCETGDHFALGRPLPLVQPGELIALLGAGAYGFSMSSNYNSRARAAEVLVERGRWGVIRPRERLTDLFNSEVKQPFPDDLP